MAARRFSRAWSAARKAAAAVGRHTPHVLCDLGGFAGAGLVSYGAWLIHQPSGFIVGGVLMIVLAMFAGRRLEAKQS